MKRKIGHIFSNYAEKRNILIDNSGKNCYVLVGKTYALYIKFIRAVEIVLSHLLHRNIPTNWNARAIHRFFSTPKVDVIHTFNTACITKKPWICTFETAVPRTNQTTKHTPFPTRLDNFTRKTFKLLAKDNCAFLIALSEANKNIQIKLMDSLNVDSRDIIAQKIIVLPPPQAVLVSQEEIDNKFSTVDDCINFIFVGGLFFRKGGAQIVDSLTKFAKKGYRFHLTVVSTLGYGDAVSRTSTEDMEYYKDILTNTEWISYYNGLPNPEVLKLCKQSHVGLLPSLADTYGYSVLEMQSCGCPVITTDIRALPEMNNNDCGYIVSVPKHPSTEAIYNTQEDLINLKKAISSGLDNIFEEIFSNPKQLKVKAESAIAKIAAEHSPDRYAEKIFELYDKAICIDR